MENQRPYAPHCGAQSPDVPDGFMIFGSLNQRSLPNRNLADFEKYVGKLPPYGDGRQRVLLSDVFDFAKVLKIKPLRLFEAASQ